MGNTNGKTITYTTQVPNTASPGQTAIYRSALIPDETVSNFADEPYENEWDLLNSGLKISGPNARCIGQRLRNPDTGVLSSQYTWLTYQDVHSSALKLGTVLYSLCSSSLEPIHHPTEAYGPAQSMILMGIHSKNRIEWFVTEYAAAAYNWALVPLYDSLNLEGLTLIFNQTKMRILACSADCLPIVLKAAKATHHLRHILLYLDPHEKMDPDMGALASECNIEILVYRDLMRTSPPAIRPCAPGKLDAVNTLCYTSGTTGLPKGVLLTNGNLIACLAGICRGPCQEFLFLNNTDTTISYLPLAHVLERSVSCVVVKLGASIGVYSGDQNLLLEDIQILEPTVFVSVPRLYNRINDAVFRRLSEKDPLSRYLFSKAKSSKLEKLKNTAIPSDKIWDPLVFAKVQKMMGSKLRYMISGGAPLDPMIQDNIRILFSVPLMEGYGLTESYGPALLASAKDPISGHVGNAVPCVEFKLCSVPECDYLVTDPNPRGELHLRGPSISVGYFLDKESTQEVFDSDGWFHTGDIAVLLPNGAVKIIDRIKNIFKLAQGEYVAVERVESIYSQCAAVSQIFIPGVSTERYLIAIVVPDEAAVDAWCKKNKVQENEEGYASQLENFILKEMNQVASANDLRGFEKVKAIHIEVDPFSIENDLLTPTLKIRRTVAQKKYAKVIHDLYQRLNKL